MVKGRSALDEIAELQQQIAAKREEALAELRDRLKEARQGVRTVEAEIEALTATRSRRAEGRQRAPKTCSVCRKQGKTVEGHTARTHARWLKEPRA